MLLQQVPKDSGGGNELVEAINILHYMAASMAEHYGKVMERRNEETGQAGKVEIFE